MAGVVDCHAEFSQFFTFRQGEVSFVPHLVEPVELVCDLKGELRMLPGKLLPGLFFPGKAPILPIGTEPPHFAGFHPGEHDPSVHLHTGLGNADQPCFKLKGQLSV